MKKYYTGAIQGQGGVFSALRSTWASRFSTIRAFIMIPSKSEKVELLVTWNARDDSDTVRLTRRNWRTGEETTLYHGAFKGGKPDRKRLPRD